MTDLLKFFTYSSNQPFPELQQYRPITCKDGFIFSCQASRGHYCSPRRDLEEGEDYSIYTEYEIGYPSEPDELITSYAESKNNLAQTVYGYVPVEIVNQLIEKHGGIDFSKPTKPYL